MNDVLSYRCSHCDANWPVAAPNVTCPECGKDTWGCPDVSDRTYQQANDARAKRPYSAQLPDAPDQPHSNTPAYAHRVERYLELGFTEADAHMLASATQTDTIKAKRGRPERRYESPLSWHRVAASLSGGCTHAQAVTIYA